VAGEATFSAKSHHNHVTCIPTVSAECYWASRLPWVDTNLGMGSIDSVVPSSTSRFLITTSHAISVKNCSLQESPCACPKRRHLQVDSRQASFQSRTSAHSFWLYPDRTRRFRNTHFAVCVESTPSPLVYHGCNQLLLELITRRDPVPTLSSRIQAQLRSTFILVKSIGTKWPNALWWRTVEGSTEPNE
jgi:hypothetical protein